MLACSVGPEPQVDRGGDRADAQRAEVAGGELDRRRQQERDHVAALHAEVEQRRGEPVGGAIEPSVGDALVGVDVGLAVGIDRGCVTQKIADQPGAAHQGECRPRCR